jgi:hypothetical protein
MHVSVKELPETIKSLLNDVGYHKADIKVEFVESLELSEPAFGDGYRGFSSIVNIATGQRQIAHGSWGGANPFENHAVDHDNKKYAIPEGVAVVKGQSGYKTFATLYMNPKNIAPGLLPEKNSIDAAQYQVLKVFRSIKPSYRKEYLVGKESGVEGLIGQKLLKRDGRGVSITLEGKNAAGGFEKENNLSGL